MEHEIELIRKFFINRDDTYAVQWESPTDGWIYVRASRKEGDERIYKPLTDKVIQRHLAQEDFTIGVYANSQSNSSKWVCLDIDIAKGADPKGMRKVAADVTKQLYKRIKSMADVSFPMEIEYSGSRGFHIWFFTEEIPTLTAKSMGMYFKSLVVPPEGITIEVYPKSTNKNLVKLPFGLHQKTGKPCVFLDPDLEVIIPLRDLENIKPWSFSQCTKFIHYFEIPKFEEHLPMDTTPRTYALPCITNMLSRGAEKGTRDEVAFTVANYCIQLGLTAEATLAVLEDWNTKNDEPLSRETLSRKIQSCQNNNYSIYPCSKEKLDPYCETSCIFYKNKMKSRGIEV